MNKNKFSFKEKARAFLLRRHNLFWAFFILNAIDKTITLIGINYYGLGAEGNPLMRLILKHNIAYFFIIEIISIAIFWFLLKITFNGKSNAAKCISWMTVPIRALAIFSWVIFAWPL